MVKNGDKKNKRSFDITDEVNKKWLKYNKEHDYVLARTVNKALDKYLTEKLREK